MDLGRLVLGSPILYLKGMRIMMFQLSGFYCSYYYDYCYHLQLAAFDASMAGLQQPTCVTEHCPEMLPTTPGLGVKVRFRV